MGIVRFFLATAAVQVYQMSEGAVDSYLAQLQARQPDLGARVVDVAKRSLGTPYADSPLGEGQAGKHDQDPLMDLTRVDCVTFVEQTLALAMSDSYKAAFDTLQYIRYRGGEISFECRNHFMIADWTANNTLCRDVTKELAVPIATISRTISRKDFFTRANAPELGQDTPDQVVELAYVATADAAHASKRLPNPALIVFIGKIDWLFALHCGLLIRDEAGKGLLYHASSKAERMVSVDFTSYIEEQASRYLGFTAYAITPSTGPVVESP